MTHAVPPSPPTANPHYSVKSSVVIAQSDTMRIVDITLAPGECIPWHLHPDNDDYVIVLHGTVEIRELLVVQGPGKVEFQRLAKLDERAAGR